mgnify:CR=1 FL=1
MKIREFCDMNMFEQILQQWCEATPPAKPRLLMQIIQ